MNVGQQVLCWKKPWHRTQSLHCQHRQAHRHQSHQEQPKTQDFFLNWDSHFFLLALWNLSLRSLHFPSSLTGKLECFAMNTEYSN